MKSKTFKTLDEQIDILKNKGLVIEDIDETRKILLRENYFFLSGYRHLFLESDSKRFLSGTTLESFMLCLLLIGKYAILFLRIY